MMFWKVSNLNLKNCIKSELSTPKRNAVSIAMLGYLYGYDYRGIIGQTFFCRILYSSHYRLAALINVQVTKSTFEKERFYSVFALGRWMLCRMNSFSSLAVKKIILSPSLFSGRESSQGLLARAQPIQVHGGHQPASNVLRERADVLARPLSITFEKQQRSRMPDDQRWGGGEYSHTVSEKAKRTTWRRPVSLFLTFKWIFPYFSFHPLPFVLSLGTTREESGSVIFTAYLQVFIHLDKIPPWAFSSPA